MKLHAQSPFTRLWIMLLLTGLTLVSLPVLSSAVTIGEEYGGGIVFSVDASGQHGLIAAKTDVPGHSSGIPEGFFTWKDAQLACKHFVSNGYSDWFLPNKEQLNQLYLQKSAVGFVAAHYNFYWSSSEGDKDHAWFQFFINGYQNLDFKTVINRVRAVRAF